MTMLLVYFSSHFTRLGGIFEMVIYHPALRLYDGIKTTREDRIGTDEFKTYLHPLVGKEYLKQCQELGPQLALQKSLNGQQRTLKKKQK